MKLVIAALCLALCYLLPFLTGQIPEVGSMLCPMHIPVLLCGFICGWPWGLVVGAVGPIMRSALTGGFPPMFPTGVCMAFELATYGAVAGLLYSFFKKYKWGVYPSLVISMVAGRLVWGLVSYLVLTVNGSSFTFSAFLSGAVINAVPGIILHLILIPVLVIAAEKANFFSR